MRSRMIAGCRPGSRSRIHKNFYFLLASDNSGSGTGGGLAPVTIYYRNEGGLAVGMFALTLTIRINRLPCDTCAMAAGNSSSSITVINGRPVTTEDFRSPMPFGQLTGHCRWRCTRGADYATAADGPVLLYRVRPAVNISGESFRA